MLTSVFAAIIDETQTQAFFGQVLAAGLYARSASGCWAFGRGERQMKTLEFPSGHDRAAANKRRKMKCASIGVTD